MIKVAVANVEISIIIMISSSRKWQDTGGMDQWAMTVCVQKQMTFQMKKTKKNRYQ